MKLINRLVLWLLLLPLLYIVGVLIYGQLTEYAPTEAESLPIQASASVIQQDAIQLMIWNVGYCGLGEKADFFMDGGEMSRSDQADVESYWAGIQQTIGGFEAETDFFLLQEVDRDSKRSYRQDYAQGLMDFTGRTGFFAPNYDVQFVPVPFLKPYGKVLSGLLTLADAQPAEAVRYPFAGNFGWPTRLFQLDRCFLLTRFELDSTDQQLVVINTHNSAYDDGTLKQQQMDQLKEVLVNEYEKGNYVIVGGDWNQYPPNFAGVAGFDTTRRADLSAMFVPETYPAAGWQWAWDPQVATNRSLATPFNQAETPRYIIDYFLVSPNVEVTSVKGVDLNFQYSDHQPVVVQVRLR